MSRKLDLVLAREIFDAAALAERSRESVPIEWERLFEEISEECERANSKTHIVFLGTALLANAVDNKVDTYARKVSAGTPGAYDARSLAHKVLVPASQIHDVHLGVTGREPLNNQPYFRISRATPEELLPIVRAPETAKRVLYILEKIDGLCEEDAQLALRAFIRVRKSYMPEYPTALNHVVGAEIGNLVRAATELCSVSSGGKNAQAIAAGVIKAAFDDGARIVCGRINDPDRNYVGDVSVSFADSGGVEGPQYAGFEVREKPVIEADVISFLKKCAENNVVRAGIVAVGQQSQLDEVSIPFRWGEERGVTCVLYQSWHSFIRDVVFWSRKPQGCVIEAAYQEVRDFLIQIESDSSAVNRWDRAFT